LSKSDFDKNGIDESGTHWLQYAALALSAIAIYTTWAYFFNDDFHHFALKIFKFINCNGYNPLSFCIRRFKSY